MKDGAKKRDGREGRIWSSFAGGFGDFSDLQDGSHLITEEHGCQGLPSKRPGHVELDLCGSAETIVKSDAEKDERGSREKVAKRRGMEKKQRGQRGFRGQGERNWPDRMG